MTDAARTSPAPGPVDGRPTVPGLVTAIRSTLRRWQFWLLLAVLGVLFAIVVQLVSVEDQDRYGLNNMNLDGYAAVAAVLEDDGVDIHPAHSAERARELLEERPEAPVVVLEDRYDADPDLVEELAEADREVIWISPTSSTRRTAFEDLSPAGSIPTSSTTDLPQVLEAGDRCTLPAAERAESVQTPGTLYSGGDGCFVHTDQDGSAHVLAETEAGVVFGAPDAFTNRHIPAEGNAALALGLFGQQPDLVWYVPSGMDALSSDEWASPWDFLPDWVDLLTWWLLFCALLLMLVAGRRHGPVVTEPLPVEVPASESAEGRGRLYQQADASWEAARTLRSAHLLRLARLLRLGPGTPEQQIISAVAGQTGRPETEIARTVDASAVSGNSAMVRYAQGLAAVEDEVRIRLGHGPRVPTTDRRGSRQEQTAQHDMTQHETARHETPREETP